MEHKLLLSRSVAVLYLESVAAKRNSDTVELIKTVLESVRPPEVVLGLNNEREMIVNIKATLMEMCQQPLDYRFIRSQILNQLRLNCLSDDRTYECIAAFLDYDENTPKPELHQLIAEHREAIANHFNEEKLAEIFNKSAHQIKFNRSGIISVSDFIAETIKQLSPYQLTEGRRKDRGIVSTTRFSNRNSVHEACQSIKASYDETGIYSFGLKGVNDMLQGGLRHGDFMIRSALGHNNKTGVSVMDFCHFAMCNKPKKSVEGKKPLLWRVTIEDKVASNMQIIYKNIRYNQTREPFDERSIDPGEATDYVIKFFESTGFEVVIDDVSGPDWSYRAFVQRAEELEAEGYVIEAVFLDYLYKINRVGCAAGAQGDDVLDMFTKIKAWTKAQNIALHTPHQLDTKAKELLKLVPPESFASELVNRGMFEGSKGIDRIYDICIHQHLIRVAGGTIINFVLDKHRLPSVVDRDLCNLFYIMPRNSMPLLIDINDDRPSHFHRYRDALAALTATQKTAVSNNDLFG